MAQAFRIQIGFCEESGALFSADLLRALLRNFEAGGDWRRLIGSWPTDPEKDVVALRAMGAIHRLALYGETPFKAVFQRLERESEDGVQTPNLTLTLWPGAQARTLASAHPHGRWVKWTG